MKWNYDNKQTKSVNNRKTGKTAMDLTWYRHFQRNGGLNQILRRQTSRFHKVTDKRYNIRLYRIYISVGGSFRGWECTLPSNVKRSSFTNVSFIYTWNIFVHDFVKPNFWSTVCVKSTESVNTVNYLSWFRIPTLILTRNS
jgi:hypothetical protein